MNQRNDPSAAATALMVQAATATGGVHAHPPRTPLAGFACLDSCMKPGLAP